MKLKLLGRICLLLILSIQHANILSLFAQSAPSNNSRDGNQIQERIKRVENSLLPPVIVKGEPVSTMNIAERMKHYNVQGLSVAVINNGKIEWAKGYGVRETETNLPVTVETVFQSGSISKPVAAMAALKMVQEGKLSLDEDVNKKLVRWKMPENEFTKEQKVTLRRLLSHSAGVSVWGFGGYPADTRVLPDVPQILDGIAPANSKPVRVIESPGTKWSYSGGGFTVMQLLMTDVLGKPFPELMEEMVLKRLGMKNSTYQLLPPDPSQQLAIGYAPKGQRPPFKWFIHPEMAAAGLWTTPSDLARFAIEIQQAFAGKSRKVLSRQMVKQMLSKQTGGSGLGVALSGEGDKAFRFSHGGANTGFRNRMVAYIGTGQGAIVMTNSEQGDAICGEIIRGIAREYGWVDYLLEKTIVQVDAQKFAGYVGEYDFLGAGKYKVLIEDGTLKAIGNTGTKYELVAESETEFFIRERPVEFTFVRDASGRVTEMILFSNGQEIRLKKL